MKTIASVLFSTLMFFYCSQRRVSNESFNIVIEDGIHKIDLAQGMYEVYREEGNQKAFFKLSKNDKQAILDFINQNSSLLKKGERDFVSIHWSLPVSENTVTIFNNQTVSVIAYCDPCYYPFDFSTVGKVDKLVKMIERICQKDENVRKLPDSNFYLE